MANDRDDGSKTDSWLKPQAAVSERAPARRSLIESLRPSFFPSLRPSAAPPERRSRTWDPREWEEDKRFVDAMDLIHLGQKRQAFDRLRVLLADDPEHEQGRLAAFHLALELNEIAFITEHAEWAILCEAQTGNRESVCNCYRQTRVTAKTLAWSERTLVTALIAGEKIRDHKVVVDATKMLLMMHPSSPALPRAFIASAEVQLAEGREDLAVRTLENVIARFPLDGLVPLAQRRLEQIKSGEADSPFDVPTGLVSLSDDKK